MRRCQCQRRQGLDTVDQRRRRGGYSSLDLLDGTQPCPGESMPTVGTCAERSRSAAGAAGPLKPEVRRSEDTISPQSKQTGSMEDGHNLDKIEPDAIHESVVTVNHLANRVVANLRDDASRQRVGLQTFHRGYEPFNEKVGVPRRVACHIGPYRFNVLDGLRRPDDLGHRRRRRFALLCSTPCPASSCANPCSTLARSTNCSIASSTVASAGSFSIASRSFCLAVLSDIRTSLDMAPRNTFTIHQTPRGLECGRLSIHAANVAVSSRGRAHASTRSAPLRSWAA